MLGRLGSGTTLGGLLVVHQSHQFFKVCAFGTLLFAGCLGAEAQVTSAVTLLTDLRDREYAQVRQYVIAAAELMPADAYAFRAVPETRTFGSEIAHIVQVNSRLCRYLNDGVLEVDPKWVKLDQESSKPVLLNALRDSFAVCDRAFAGLTNAAADEVVTTASGRRVPKGSTLTIVTAHSNEEYGKLSVLLRLKGLVPPSSQPPQ